MDAETSPIKPENRLKWPQWSTRVSKLSWLFGAAIVLGIVIGIIAIIIFRGSALAVPVPAHITEAAKSPIYVPLRLPGTYELVTSSFGISQNIVTFTATDSTNSKLVFTQQPKPQDLNFNDFYKTQITETKVLSSTKYPSVWGKLANNRLLLSVVTNDTWVLMTTNAPLGEAEMQRIAQGIIRK